MKRNATYHQLLTQYIEQIGRTETPEVNLPVAREPGWNQGIHASFQLMPHDQQWEMRLFYFDRSASTFHLADRQLYPTRVVAEIMGRYHCRIRNDQQRKKAAADSSTTMLN